MVGNAAVRLGHRSGIAAVGANIPAGMLIRVAALHNGYGSILFISDSLSRRRLSSDKHIPLPAGLITCVISGFDAAKGAAGQGH